MSRIHRYIIALILVLYFVCGLILVLVSGTYLYDFFGKLSTEEAGAIFSGAHMDVLFGEVGMAGLSIIVGGMAILSVLWLYSAQHKKNGLYLAIATLAIFWVMGMSASGVSGFLKEDWIMVVVGLGIGAYLIVQRNAIINYEANQLTNYLQSRYGEHRN